MLKETIKIILILLAVTILTGGPAYLKFRADARRALQRRSLGLPPIKKQRTPLIVRLFFFGFILIGVYTVGTDLLDMVAKDKVNAANGNAQSVYRWASDFAKDADESDCVTVIAQISQKDTPLKAAICTQAEQYQAYRGEDWYAVVFRDGKLQYALYSGHPLTYADLHRTDFETERRKVRKPGTSFRDAVGYYTKTEKLPSGSSGEELSVSYSSRTFWKYAVSRKP